MTRQRRVILEEVKKNNCHPSADEVYERVRQRLPRISLATVYRNLEVLSELKQIQTIEHCGSQKRFDCNPENHYHIRCMRCDRVDDAPVCLLDDLEDRLLQETGYQVLGHRLEFIGLCDHCCGNLAIRKGEKSLLL